MGAKTSGSRSTKICGGSMRGGGEREKGREESSSGEEEKSNSTVGAGNIEVKV